LLISAAIIILCFFLQLYLQLQRSFLQCSLQYWMDGRAISKKN